MTCRVIVFAKAPVPGFAKTRLIPALGAEAAAALAERMLHHALAEALAAGLGPVELCGTPTVRHAGFSRVAADKLLPLTLPGPHSRGPAVLEFSDQGDGDLGERMLRALQRTLLESTPSCEPPAAGRDGAKAVAATTGVLLVGSDIPGLERQVLRAAAAALGHSDAVFVPTHDGGYALIGLRPPAPVRLGELFADMPWSGPQVMALTRARLARLNLRHAELPALHDIDGPADLVHLPARWLPSGAGT